MYPAGKTELTAALRIRDGRPGGYRCQVDAVPCVTPVLSGAPVVGHARGR
jgi:hypothetical protein